MQVRLVNACSHLVHNYNKPHILILSLHPISLNISEQDDKRAVSQ